MLLSLYIKIIPRFGSISHITGLRSDLKIDCILPFGAQGQKNRMQLYNKNCIPKFFRRGLENLLQHVDECVYILFVAVVAHEANAPNLAAQFTESTTNFDVVL